jgi:predicted phosphodiesterase
VLVAVLADIHGNLPALEAVLEDARQYGVNVYLAAGDMVTGPLANEVITGLVDVQARMILGNNELNMIGYARHSVPEPCFTHLQYGFTRHSY